MSAAYRVVHCDAGPQSFAIERAELARANAELVPVRPRSEEELIETIRDADGLLVVFRPITARVIDALRRCRVIGRYGVGVDNVDLDAATARGIVVANVPDYCLHEVSNHALTFLLACAKQLVPLNNAAKGGSWRKAPLAGIGEIYGQTLGIIGLGNIGQLVARKARAFGMEVLAHDPFVPERVAAAHEVALVPLAELLERSDYVSVHTPLTAETQGMLGEREFRMMKPGACLINTSRGGVLDEAALVEALRAGWIAGAALDVLAKEPPDADHPLLAMENVILPPHTAAQSRPAMAELSRRVAAAVADVLGGRWPPAVANPAVRERITLAE